MLGAVGPIFAHLRVSGRSISEATGEKDNMRRRKFLVLGLAPALALGTLSACAPGSGDNASGETASKAPSEISTDPASLGDVELKVWDQEVRGSQNDALEALNKAFQEKYPNIKIKRTSQSNDDLQQQIALALSGNDVPDVAQVNNCLLYTSDAADE